MAAAFARELSPGDMVGSYEIEAVLATGTTSTTFRARHVSLARTVVLRVFHAHVFAADPAARERAHADAVQAGRLEHPGLATVYDAGTFDDGIFVASALVEGQTLAELVDDEGVTPHRCGEIVTAVADALGAAHRAGVIHGEVRPEAITLGRWGNPVVRDFGVMRWSGRTAHATREELIDTLQYAAPEVVLGRPAEAATDLYGLAATALFCLTGSPPSPGLSPSQLLTQRTTAPPPPLAVPDSALPALLAAAMTTDPAHRPLPLAAFASALTTAVAALPAPLRDAPSPFELVADAGAAAAAPHAGRAAAPARSDATRIDRVRDVAPAAPPAEPSDRKPLVVAAALAATIVVGAFGIGEATAPGPPQQPRVGTFRLHTAPLWQTGGAGFAGASVRSPVRLVGAPGHATVGLLAAANASPDPLAARPRDARGPFSTAPTIVRAGTRSLLRYAGSAGSGAVAFALPTDRQTLLAQCDAATPEPKCAALLTGADLGGAHPRAAAPADRTVTATAELLRQLEVERGTAAAELAGAPAARAQAASRLAGACRTAAEQLAAAKDPALDALRDALTASADAYDELADATDRRSDAGYRAARERALTADRALAQRTKALAAFGFPVAG